MNPFRHLPLVVAVLQGGVAVAQVAPQSALEDLASRLAVERAKPQGTKSDAKCPADIKTLVGLTRKEIHLRLGGPDLFTLGTVSPPKITAATYFISPKALPGARGGGAPEVTFRFDEDERVIQAACTLSR
jgi:hypothetical protein